MRILLTLLLLVPLTVQGQAIWRNFFVTNQNPRVTVVAGSNATVQASLVGVDQRIFTVNAIPGGAVNTNDLNGWLSTNVAGFAGYATNAGFATNATYALWGTNSFYVLTAILTNQLYGSNIVGAVPEATHATNADNASNSTNFWGVLAPTNLPAGLATSNFVGTFTGNGASISNLAGYVNVKDFGAKGDGVTDDWISFTNAVLTAQTNWRAVMVPPGTYVISNTVGLTNCTLFGYGPSSVLNVSKVISNAIAIGCGTNATVRDLKLIGAGDGKGTETRYPIRMGNNSIVDGVWIDSAYSGIDATVKNGIIRNYTASNLRGSNGWANAIECDAGSDGIYGDNITVRDSDRGIEVENGARNCFFSKGTLLNVSPAVAYQSSVILDVHDHTDATLPCENIRYENFYLSNCLGLTVVGSADLTTMPRNVLYDSITICNPTNSSATNPDFSFDTAQSVTIRNVKILNCLNFVRLTLTSLKDFTADGLQIQNAPRAQLAMANSTGLRFVNCTFATTNSSSYSFDTSGTGTNLVIQNCTFMDVKSYGGLNINKPYGLEIRDNLFIMDASSPGTYAMRLNGTNILVSGNRITGSPVTAAITIGDDYTSVGGLIYGNSSVAGAIRLTAGASGFVVRENRMGSGTMTDSGTGNLWFYNSPSTLSSTITNSVNSISIISGGSIIATNGYSIFALDNIPTNSIPASTAANTNWVLLNWTNTGPVFVATNTAAAGSFLLRQITTTLSAWP